MEFWVILIIFALGLLVVAQAFCHGVGFAFGLIKKLFHTIF